MQILLLFAAILLQDNEEHARLLSAKATPEKVASGGVVMVRFEIDIDPEWHIYPTREQSGTAPTVFTFEGPVAVAGAVREPRTKRHSEALAGGKKFEYDYIDGPTALFGVPVRVDAPEGAFALKGQISGQACKEVCFDMVLPFEIPLTVTAPEPKAAPGPFGSEKGEVAVAWARPLLWDAANGETVNVELRLVIPDGWYIYPFNKKRGVGKAPEVKLDNAVVVGPVEEPAPKAHEDKSPDLTYDYHEGTINVLVPVALKGTKAGPVEVKGTLSYQICGGPEQVCTDGSTPIAFTLTSLGGEASAKKTDVPQGDEPAPDDWIRWALLAIVGGLGTLVTPCVFPMLPITMTYFLKQAEGSRTRGLALGGLYGLGIVLTFTAIGLIFSIAIGGDGPRIFAANPWVNLAVAALFGWFAFSMFGLYEIALPSSLTDRLTGSGSPRKGYGGAFLLGLLFTVVTFTCTVPIAASILTLTAEQSRGMGIFAMLVYSLTMALPFVLMGAFPALVQRLRGSGGNWLHAVKITMAFIELGLASYYLMKVDLVWGWGVLTRPVMLAIYVGVLLLAALYLLGVFRMKGDEEGAPAIGVGRACAALLLLVLAVYIASGYAGRPLGDIDTVLPPIPREWQTGSKGGEPAQQHFATYEDALAEARKTGKPIFLEFTGVT